MCVVYWKRKKGRGRGAWRKQCMAQDFENVNVVLVRSSGRYFKARKGRTRGYITGWNILHDISVHWLLNSRWKLERVESESFAFLSHCRDVFQDIFYTAPSFLQIQSIVVSNASIQKYLVSNYVRSVSMRLNLSADITGAAWRKLRRWSRHPICIVECYPRTI